MEHVKYPKWQKAVDILVLAGWSSWLCSSKNE